MKKIPNNLYYTKDHQWIKCYDNNIVKIGITEYAQKSLGDIIHIELPIQDSKLKIGKEFSIIESVKTSSNLISSISGIVVKKNNFIIEYPENLNIKPYKYWLLKVKLKNEITNYNLLNAHNYLELIKNS